MTKQQSAWKSPWVIGWILALVAFIIISGTRIYFAVKTDPGLVDDNFYERGQEYEENMLKRRARDAKVIMKIIPPEFIDVQKPALIRYRITNLEGVALRPDEVTLFAYRSADVGQDFSLPMREEQEGRYGVDASFPLKGVWELVVSAKIGEEEYNTPAYRFSAGVHTPQVD